MKTIRQLSDELKISKEALYKKLKYQLKEQLAVHVEKIDNVTHIDDEGERLIIQSLHRERQEALQGVLEAEPYGSSGIPEYVIEHLNVLTEQIKTKDAQIEAQGIHIGLLIRQLGINRLLIHAERFKSLATSSESVPTTVTERKHRVWRRIFRKFKVKKY